MAQFADMLAYLRKRSDLSQQELADKLDMTRSAIGMYETGKREPDLETLEAFADFFNVDMNTLTGSSAASTYTMFNSVQYIRDICQQRKIPISQLEKECGFSNGYLNPKKISKISYERALIISEYLSISVESIMNGPESEKAPTQQGESGDILDEVDVAFYGAYKELTEDDKETVRDMVRLMRERRKGK